MPGGLRSLDENERFAIWCLPKEMAETFEGSRREEGLPDENQKFAKYLESPERLKDTNWLVASAVWRRHRSRLGVYGPWVKKRRRFTNI